MEGKEKATEYVKQLPAIQKLLSTGVIIDADITRFVDQVAEIVNSQPKNSGK